jgi:hypothetical protein
MSELIWLTCLKVVIVAADVVEPKLHVFRNFLNSSSTLQGEVMDTMESAISLVFNTV